MFVLDYTERIIDSVINTTPEAMQSPEMQVYFDHIVNREFLHIIRYREKLWNLVIDAAKLPIHRHNCFSIERVRN